MSLQLTIIHLQVVRGAHGDLQHGQPVFRCGVGWPPVRRGMQGYQAHLGERQSFVTLDCHAQVPVVHGIEGSTEDAYRLSHEPRAKSHKLLGKSHK